MCSVKTQWEREEAWLSGVSATTRLVSPRNSWQGSGIAGRGCQAKSRCRMANYASTAGGSNAIDHERWMHGGEQ